MFNFVIVNLMILLLKGLVIQFECSRYWCSSEFFFLKLGNIGLIVRIFKSVGKVPSMFFDRYDFRPNLLPEHVTLQLYANCLITKQDFISFCCHYLNIKLLQHYNGEYRMYMQGQPNYDTSVYAKIVRHFQQKLSLSDENQMNSAPIF